ncbi:MAG: alpha/beta hydrolase [Planctomycetaceae bacterium]|nr:alpha/beta hydrolase [Planctomycetaceae bacterium]
MFYKETGQRTGRMVLFLHGFPFDHTLWLETARHLGDSRRLIFPDLRGFGQTTLPVPEVSTMSQFAQDTADLMDRLDKTSRIVVCGLSMGGYVAMHFAQRFGDRLAGLILCDTKAQSDTDAAAQNRMRRAAALPETGLDALADAMLPNLFAPQTGNDIRDTVRQMILRQPLGGVAAADRGMAERPDATDWLPGFSMPTLVICGEQDTISPVGEMKQMAAKIPNARFLSIANAGHLPPVEAAGSFALAVKNFLGEIF